jgi:hypothetical protein
MSTFSDAKDRVAPTVSGATPDTDQVKERGRQAVGIAQSNPLGLAIGAAAAGFVAGLLVPATRVEDERLGAVADQVKESAQELGQEVVERGREVAQETLQSAKETATQSAAEHGQGLADTARERASDSGNQPA